MKVLVAFCSRCGWATDDLDDLYAHAATSHASTVACPECGAAPGQRCTTASGRTARRQHTDRQKAA
jgi:hypothetical protein